jgi:hypothetical protein
MASLSYGSALLAGAAQDLFDLAQSMVRASPFRESSKVANLQRLG